MLFHEQSFEQRLNFFKLNICQFPQELTASQIDFNEPELVINGLKQLEELFNDIYSAVEVFDIEDPAESLHNVANTLMFLYSAGYTGELCQQGSKYYLEIVKKELKSHYKLSMNKPVENLSQFGFYCEFYKNGKETDTLNKCTVFHLYCDNYDYVPLALSYIMKNAFKEVNNNDYARMQGLFYKLDYRSLILNESTRREDISPVRDDILHTANTKADYLQCLFETISERYPLCVKPKLHEYYTPHWILQCFTKSKNTFVFNVNVVADAVCLEIRLAIETVEKLAQKKDMLSDHLREELQKFGCIECNNHCGQENVREFEGIKYCCNYSEARLLTFYINSKEDLESVYMIMDIEQEAMNWK